MPQNFGIDDAVLTYEDYRNTPDDQRYELIDGVFGRPTDSQHRSPKGSRRSKLCAP